MYKKLVKCNRGYFEEVDPVMLKRMAIKLRDQIHQKIAKDNDKYQFYSFTLPIVEDAILGKIQNSFNDEREFVSGQFWWDDREGFFPSDIIDREFLSAFSGFSVTIRGGEREKTDDVIVDGVIYRWLDLEEESDWPDKMKFP